MARCHLQRVSQGVGGGVPLSLVPSSGAGELRLTPRLKCVQCQRVVTRVDDLVDVINYHWLWLDYFKEKGIIASQLNARA